MGHGTHVAGTIGAVGNNSVGVVGVNWQVKIMPLKAFKPFLGIFCAASDADLMVVVGTSSAVYPAAALPGLTKGAGGRVVELNLEPTPLSAIADASSFGEVGRLLPAIWSRIGNPKGL